MDTTQNSGIVGAVKVTIAAGPTATSPSAQACRSCLVIADSENTGTITVDYPTADGDSFPVLATTYLPIPIQNLDELSFYSGTAGDVVYILWRD